MRRLERRQNRHGGLRVAGAGTVLTLVGVVFLLQILGIPIEIPGTWWALIILVPAAGAFANSWRIYRSSNRLSTPARASLIGGILLTMVTAIFLFDLNWPVLGPVLSILAGLGLLINILLPG